MSQAPAASPTNIDTSPLAESVRRAMVWRITPLLFAMYAMFSLDRGNVGFAASALEKHLGIDPVVYGLSASLFTVAYLIAQVPVIQLMKRFKPAFALGLVAASFGIVSASTALIGNSSQFLFARIMLGLAEAGFGSFVVYYVSQIVPSQSRGAVMAATLSAVPISMIFASPLSGYILSQDFGGLHAWQWLFIIEGLPAVLFGIAAVRLLPNSAHTASFLSEPQQEWLSADLAAGEATHGTAGTRDVSSLGAIIRTPGVWILGLVLFTQTLGTSIMLFWMPKLIEQLSGGSGVEVGVLGAFPWIAFALGMLTVGRISSRFERKARLLALSIVVAMIGFAIVGLLPANQIFAAAGLLIGAFGIGAMIAVFWTVPMQLLRGAALASAFAMINMIGNSSGVIAHGFIGLLVKNTGSVTGSMVALALVLLAGLTLLVGFEHFAARQRES